MKGVEHQLVLPCNDAICSHSVACLLSILLWLSHGFACPLPLPKLNCRCSLHSLSICKFGPTKLEVHLVLALKCSQLSLCVPPSSPSYHCVTLYVLQEQQVACMDACAAEYTGKVPKMKADCQQQLKKLGV